MKKPFPLLFVLCSLILGFCLPASAENEKKIPEELKAWTDWATWGSSPLTVPRPYNDAKKPLSFWPSSLNLALTNEGGAFEMEAVAFEECWLALPGTTTHWPENVTVITAGESRLGVVVPHHGFPSVRLTKGRHRISGRFVWAGLPEYLTLPASIGLIDLTINGQPVTFPAWDREGKLWLRRQASAEQKQEEDFLDVSLYSLLKDGVPMRLTTEIELTVSGKNREEFLGVVLPQGWELASVKGDIPLSIDADGLVKAQVRSGKWVVTLEAFSTQNQLQLTYPEGLPAAAPVNLVAFEAAPTLRTLSVGGNAIDVAQTNFPAKWRHLPVYRWETATPLLLEEHLRGMGKRLPSSLSIERRLWLNQTGNQWTFSDNLNGTRQQFWRLDAISDLGSVTNQSGEGTPNLLITRNPLTNTPGVELRQRDLQLQATGLIERQGALPATGWQADAAKLSATLHLPPGWRLFALFGADSVQGDWLTAWSLADVFLLLIFVFALYRRWGMKMAAIGAAAFLLSYHDYQFWIVLWIALLVFIALESAIKHPPLKKLIAVLKWSLAIIIGMGLVNFTAREVRGAIYPQLEKLRGTSLLGFAFSGSAHAASFVATGSGVPPGITSMEADSLRESKKWSDLKYATDARIQTGPGIPQWTWRTITAEWSGPVASTQTFRPILIPPWLSRPLMVLRAGLLLILFALLLYKRRSEPSSTPDTPSAGGSSPASAVAILACLLAFGSPAQAEIPDSATLETLRKRLLQPNDAFPHAANIPIATIALQDNQFRLSAEIHTATLTAVPLPIQLTGTAPVRVTQDGTDALPPLRRIGDNLWIVLSPGVYRIHVAGYLPEGTQWTWSYALKPRRVQIASSDWTFRGVTPDGRPEDQVFFTRDAASATNAAPSLGSYDNLPIRPLLKVERHLELGLNWQVRTVIRRQTPDLNAIALQVPLLPGERPLNTPFQPDPDGAHLNVFLRADEESVQWRSELTVAEELRLRAAQNRPWTEEWHLLASPVWNVTPTGIAPIFTPDETGLIPIWYPWPGEEVLLTLQRPEAVAGPTLTIESAAITTQVGKRQRSGSLRLKIRCSIGQELPIGLHPEADITALKVNGGEHPVRIIEEDGQQWLSIPVRPGDSDIFVDWNRATPSGLVTTAESVTFRQTAFNISTVLTTEQSRWTLWTFGPLLGPAVQYWGVLALLIVAALVLGKMAKSPLRTWEWLLLLFGLSWMPLLTVLLVVIWFYLIKFRREEAFPASAVSFNFAQIGLVGATGVVTVIFLITVITGLTSPLDMEITGNGSTNAYLRWSESQTPASPDVSEPTAAGFLSLNIWFYRALMLAWSLWLAAFLIRWYQNAWNALNSGGFFRSTPPREAAPPPFPKRTEPKPEPPASDG